MNPWRLIKMKVPGRLQYAVKAMLPQRLQKLVFRWYAGARNWAGCRAIAVPNNDSTGAIRVLVKGRDRYGVVSPGHEYRKTCESIAGALGELVDPQTGRKVARQVTLTYEEFKGRFLDQLPDLTVLWDQRFAWDEVASQRIGNLKIRRQDSRSGSHTLYGFLLARGYGASPGATVRRLRFTTSRPRFASGRSQHAGHGWAGAILLKIRLSAWLKCLALNCQRQHTLLRILLTADVKSHGSNGPAYANPF